MNIGVINNPDIYIYIVSCLWGALNMTLLRTTLTCRNSSLSMTCGRRKHTHTHSNPDPLYYSKCWPFALFLHNMMGTFIIFHWGATVLADPIKSHITKWTETWWCSDGGKLSSSVFRCWTKESQHRIPARDVLHVLCAYYLILVSSRHRCCRTSCTEQNDVQAKRRKVKRIQHKAKRQTFAFNRNTEPHHRWGWLRVQREMTITQPAQNHYCTDSLSPPTLPHTQHDHQEPGRMR